MTIAQTIMDRFDECVDENRQGIPAETIKEISDMIPDEDTLRECLPSIKEKISGFKEAADNCDAQIKLFQSNKKIFQQRASDIGEFVKEILGRLGAKSITDGNIKASVTLRSVLDVNETEILKDYTSLIAALEQQLPDYIKVKCVIDKTALTNFVKTAPNFLINNPDKANWKPSSSVTIK